MKKFCGKGVYGAIAIGRVSVFSRQGTNITQQKAEDPEQELKRLAAAKALASAQLAEIYEKACSEVGEENAQIFEIHMMMLEDEDHSERIETLIRTEQATAEYAVLTAGNEFSEMFASMDDDYMQARAADVKDISNRLISCLTGSSETGDAGSDMHILCADDLAPSETVSLDKSLVVAFVTAFGSSNSHTAILARNMDIPAVIGAGEEFLSAVKDGDMLIVDGHTGDLILDPDTETEQFYRARQEEDYCRAKSLSELKGRPNITKDGREIRIYANIGGPDGVDAALENDAGGIGLFRSEFLYLERSDCPTEEQQFDAYKDVLTRMEGRQVIIRTLDIGADKQIDYFGLKHEDNPALGLRAVRLSLTRPELFRTQLRALYRASVYGQLGIMFPMITSVSEVEKCLAACEEVKRELSAEGIAYSDSVEIGIMVETPAAAVISDLLAQIVDFFSIGTNDLTQYTLACDRQDPALEAFADPHHEAVLRLIELTAKNAHAHDTWVGICGELAADTSLTQTFLRMGIDELSVSAPFILPLREAVRSSTAY
ncbi:phosphoenolpyruvate--protein phosphotransferase [Ruminococcus sp.]|uniref:phosphoenolpyruvate--protein phosphotransferase n=1 Tax=Ruminococcus sp. TaxID=41978 RepID=UPI0025E9BCCF|nr:phosphoenolpyruvate--protein phosphotransferase [Ruminococcus sp.]MBQ8967257.1 phosphoenolpyruvate--protein phosphotransferase [Ruminococcus sp.]